MKKLMVKIYKEDVKSLSGGIDSLFPIHGKLLKTFILAFLCFVRAAVAATLKWSMLINRHKVRKH